MPRQTDLPLGDPAPLARDETSRSIALGDRIVPYILRRSRRKTIGLTIDHRGLRVGAPPRATLADIEAMLYRYGDWVGQKLDEWRDRRFQQRFQIADGALLPVLGQDVQLRIEPIAHGLNRGVWAAAPSPTLTLCLQTPLVAPRILTHALQQRARTLFEERLTHFAALLGVARPNLSLSSARTRWGCCSLKTGIHLNWRLIHFPLPVIDYVVVHELAHLEEMNHSRRFWAVVARQCPDYKARRDELKRLATTCPRW